MRLPAALPADHDDDHGGAVRHAADRARLRRRRGAAPAARHRGGRRPRVSQLLTLYITPVIYLLLEEFGTRIGAGRREAVPVSAADGPMAAHPQPTRTAAE